MSADSTVSTSFTPAALQETVTRAKERCRTIQDTLDAWIDLGGDFDTLACAWIAEQGANVGKVTTLRKRKGKEKKPEGLRKKCIAHLEALVGSTGFTGKEINKALQLFGLEKSAGWVQQLKSDGKASELRTLARWHWEGCKLTRAGERCIRLAKESLLAVGPLESLTVKQVREVVRSVLGKETKPRNMTRAAAVAFFQAIEGTDKQAPADRADVASWLDVLLAESPIAAEIITEACERYIDGLAGQGRVAKVA
ncbi:MAG: hypothetical protein ACJ8FY_12815 [Gemmataceae bacterium]